jgi:hypothetical protein
MFGCCKCTISTKQLSRHVSTAILIYRIILAIVSISVGVAFIDIDITCSFYLPSYLVIHGLLVFMVYSLNVMLTHPMVLQYIEETKRERNIADSIFRIGVITVHLLEKFVPYVCLTWLTYGSIKTFQLHANAGSCNIYLINFTIFSVVANYAWYVLLYISNFIIYTSRKNFQLVSESTSLNSNRNMEVYQFV